MLKEIPPEETREKDARTGKHRRRSNPTVKAAARYNREIDQASFGKNDGIYMTQNGAQITIRKGEITQAD